MRRLLDMKVTTIRWSDNGARGRWSVASGRGGLRFARLGSQGATHAETAAVADITQLPDLLHGQEREVFGDQAYWKEDDRAFLESWGVRYRINRRPSRRPLSKRWRMINRARSRTRARGEHAFRIVKQLWGFAKVKYRGPAKNLARAQTMFALANLYPLGPPVFSTSPTNGSV